MNYNDVQGRIYEGESLVATLHGTDEKLMDERGMQMSAAPEMAEALQNLIRACKLITERFDLKVMQKAKVERVDSMASTGADEALDRARAALQKAGVL